jgi:DNA polymerase-3 subunit epsilon
MLVLRKVESSEEGYVSAQRPKLIDSTPFPRIYATREVAADGTRYFGAFRSKRQADLTIELVHRIFPIRICTRALSLRAKVPEPCQRFHLKRCSAPCGARCSKPRKRCISSAQPGCATSFIVWISRKLITGAVEANNLLIVYPSARQNSNEPFLIRHGRLVEQRCIEHGPASMEQAVGELLQRAAVLEELPGIVGQAEIDQINMLSRWIHRHSEDRAFFPIKSALIDFDNARMFARRVWAEVGTGRGLFAAPLSTLRERSRAFFLRLRRTLSALVLLQGARAYPCCMRCGPDQTRWVF